MEKYTWDNGNYKKKEEQDEQQSFVIGKDGTVDVSSSETYKPSVVDEDGNDASDMALQLIKGGRFNAKLFHEQFEDNTEQVLNALLSMQSNSAPLKRGGDTIAFRCDAVIIQNRQNYTAAQNTLLDIIMAKMSSYPEDQFYMITAKELINQLPYADKTYIYKIMSNTCKELNRSPFLFEIELDNGKKKIIELQWNKVLMYNGADDIAKDEDAYISFTPTEFFRVLTASSTIMHGAHYPIGVPAQISSKYARNLFYYLESMKRYREYESARPGVFTLSLEELQYIVKYPNSYRTTDIRRFVLDTAVEEINRIENIDFTFSYEFIKTGKSGSKKKITHVRFIISNTVETKAPVAEIEEKEPGPSADDVMLMQILQGTNLTEQECKDVIKKYKANNRTVPFLVQAITSVVTTKDAKSQCALLCYIMDYGLNSKLSAEENMKRMKKTSKPQNRFNNFEQREYNQEFYDELERNILGDAIKNNEKK